MKQFKPEPIPEVLKVFHEKHPAVETVHVVPGAGGWQITLTTSVGEVKASYGFPEEVFYGSEGAVMNYLLEKLELLAAKLYKLTVESWHEKQQQKPQFIKWPDDNWFFADEVHETLDDTPEGWSFAGEDDYLEDWADNGQPQQLKHLDYQKVGVDYALSNTPSDQNIFSYFNFKPWKSQDLWEAKLKSASSTPLYYTGLPYPEGFGKSINPYVTPVPGNHGIVTFTDKDTEEQEEFARELDEWLS